MQDIDKIVNAIKRNNCVLVIGRNAIFDAKEKRVHKKYVEKLQEVLGSNSEVKNDQFFSLGDEVEENYGTNQLEYIAEEAYKIIQKEEVHDIYSRLVQIKFRLMISTTPDNVLQQSFKNIYGKSLTTDYFGSDKNGAELAEIPSPFLYKMFGTIHDVDSVFLTHDKLFDYLFAISKSELPIDKIINSKTLFLFLGFDFDSWYTKLLLKKLDDIKDNINGSFSNSKEKSFAYPFQKLNKEDVKLYGNKFNIQFVENDVISFVDKLYNICEEQGLIFNKSEIPNELNNAYKKIVHLVETSEIDNAIAELREIRDELSSDISKQITSLIILYNTSKKSHLTRKITDDHYLSSNQRMIDNLLNILDDIKVFLERA